MSELHTYELGELRVTKITEQVFDSLTVGQLYPDATPDSIAMLDSDPALTMDSPAVMSIHSWLVETPDHRMLIDTASGNRKNRPFSNLFHQLHTPWLEILQGSGVRPADIDFVLHTHLHVDHVGWNTVWDGERWVPTFHNAVHICSKAELDFYASPESAPRAMVFEDSIRPVQESGQLRVISDHGQEVLPGVRFLPTPGHSRGHMSISIKAGNEVALFCGDVMHTPIQVARPTWNSRFCEQQAAARESRKKLSDHASTLRATVFTSHFAESSVGRVAELGEHYSWTFL
jgi:glyoxylase-like metal-dependent hydrolase (beta-lactamase superfamily II)